jgi:hypothetical protein
MLVAMFAQAQFYVGGGVSFSKSEIANEKTSVFTFSPEVGYNINDNLSLGATLSFTTQEDSYTEYSFEPYVRYTFFKSGNFSFFAESFVAVGSMDIENDSSHFLWGAGISPGLSCNISKRLTAVAHVGVLSYMDCEDVLQNTTVSLDCSDISFSLYYNF